MQNHWLNNPNPSLFKTSTILKKCRWTIEPLGDPNGPWRFANQVKIDYYRKEITVSLYATDCDYLEKWLEQDVKNLLFKSFDGSATLIYEIGIFNIRVSSLEEDYDCKVTNALETKIFGQFDKYTKVWH